MALNHTQAALTAIMNRVQELENAVWTLLSAMSINGASNDLLDKIGAIVGEKRLGRTDADFRASIRLRIRVNVSAGRSLDVLAVAMLAYAPLLPLYLEPGYQPAFLLDMPNLQSGQYVAAAIKRTRSLGTYGLVCFTTNASAVLTLDSNTVGAVTSPGTLDSLSGGVSTPGQMSVGLGV